ncbi:hypothetical protein [Bradyrhizobium sp. SZCCHNRI1073]|uniref:hypothetical protein n=1 Tax=Bradyrhizobium sp. SZCCHNRI1073 TaxID=3057280 RepID=UPI00291667C8|nr:hypothetical protein [Bradyrhizobium sp. SZCCHNRI1073]
MSRSFEHLDRVIPHGIDRPDGNHLADAGSEPGVKATHIARGCRSHDRNDILVGKVGEFKPRRIAVVRHGGKWRNRRRIATSMRGALRKRSVPGGQG